MRKTRARKRRENGIAWVKEWTGLFDIRISTTRRTSCSLPQSAQPRSGEGKDQRLAGKSYTLTILFPLFSPASNPISACGVFSIPSITSSSTLILPDDTQPCRSLSAWSRCFM